MKAVHMQTGTIPHTSIIWWLRSFISLVLWLLLVNLHSRKVLVHFHNLFRSTHYSSCASLPIFSIQYIYSTFLDIRLPRCTPVTSSVLQTASLVANTSHPLFYSFVTFAPIILFLLITIISYFKSFPFLLSLSISFRSVDFVFLYKDFFNLTFFLWFISFCISYFLCTRL